MARYAIYTRPGAKGQTVRWSDRVSQSLSPENPLATAKIIKVLTGKGVLGGCDKSAEDAIVAPVRWETSQPCGLKTEIHCLLMSSRVSEQH